MSTDRFGGLINLFNTITWSGDKLISVKNKITLDNIPQNKKDWMAVAKNLIFKCEKFVKHDVVCV